MLTVLMQCMLYTSVTAFINCILLLLLLLLLLEFYKQLYVFFSGIHCTIIYYPVILQKLLIYAAFVYFVAMRIPSLALVIMLAH
jgi:hypothetical protein